MVKLKAEIVKKYIAKHNMTHLEFSSLLRTSPAFFSQLLHGTRNPGPELRKQLMKLMKIKDWNVLFEMVEG